MRLSIFLILAAVVLSCNNSTSTEPEPEPEPEPEEEVFEPYTKGNFIITSPVTAELARGNTSNKSKAMQDTIHIYEAGDFSLSFKHDTLEGIPDNQVKAYFVDSTFTDYPLDSPETFHYERINPKNINGSYAVTMDFNEFLLDDNIAKWTLLTSFNCSAKQVPFPNNDPVFTLKVYINNEAIKVYAIHIDGILETLDDITPDRSC